jgi:hypothetical protein
VLSGVIHDISIELIAFVLGIEAVFGLLTLENKGNVFLRNVGCHIPEERNPQQLWSENLKIHLYIKLQAREVSGIYALKFRVSLKELYFFILSEPTAAL